MVTLCSVFPHVRQDNAEAVAESACNVKSGDELDLDTARSKATAYEYLCHLEATKRCASVHVLVCAPHPSVMTG